MSTCLLVAITIFTNKELKDTHPSLLLAAMSICEFITCWNVFVWTLNPVKLSCYFGTDKALKFTVRTIMYMLHMDSASSYSDDMALKLIVQSNIFFFEIAQ